MILLGIESSCDETAAAVVADGRLVQTGTLNELAADPAEDTVRRLLFLPESSKAL